MRLVIALTLLAGCGSKRVQPSAEASAAYRTAWLKHRAGDEQGYRAGLEEIVRKYPSTRAAERAKERLR